MTHQLFEKHRHLLDEAVGAYARKAYWSAFPEHIKAYGEDALTVGQAAFEARLSRPFVIEQAGIKGEVGGERSPYGFDLGITYPGIDIDVLLPAVEHARQSWACAGKDVWAGVSMEIVARLNQRSAEMAHAVMHTTGQALMMAFQAGGPHAQDRALETIACAWDQLSRIPDASIWEKPQGKNPPIRMEKHYAIVPRGIALIVGCCTFPTWNGYTGIFASLATGNAVIVKPHPGAILPLAITVEVAREVLTEAGFDPDVVTLAAHNAEASALPAKLATRPEVKIIDFTGSTTNGEWLEATARQAQVFTEKSGVNQIVIDSCSDIAPVVRNIAFSLALYSGQMCTTPQNIYVPRFGIDTAQGHIPFEKVCALLVEALDKLLGDDARAVEVLGAIQNEGVLQRLAEAGKLGNVLAESRAIEHPKFAGAHVHTPLLVELNVTDEHVYSREWFGPIAFVIATDDTAQSLAVAERMARECGALTLSVYTDAVDVREHAVRVAHSACVALSLNLTGAVFVNQSAAFSDYHGTGGNPAANSALTDATYIVRRFCVVQHRWHAEV